MRSALRLAVALLALAGACLGGSAPQAARRPNVLLLCVDDLRPELHSFGVDYIHSPNIDRLVARGRGFSRHYVQAPTCGASRYSLLTGRYSIGNASRGNGALVERAKAMDTAFPALPDHFRQHGYTTVSLGKISHHPGGRYGTDWNDPAAIEMPGAWDLHEMPVGPWQHPLGAMHALANGHVRGANTPALESFDGPDESYPDGLIAQRAIEELDRLGEAAQPFFLAVGFIRPHLPFGAPARYLRPYEAIELPPIPHPERPVGRTTWHGSGEFFGPYQHGDLDPREDAGYATRLRKHYAACVTYIDALVGRVVARLDALGLADETIVVLWGDHGWHLGEHGIWGKHSLFEESLRSPLIVCAPGMKAAGEMSDAVVESVDVFPTLCDLAGLPSPASLDGRSLLPQLELAHTPGRPALSYQANRETIRTERFRLIRQRRNGEIEHLELYDHDRPEQETRNVAADHPDVVAALLEVLDGRLQ